MKLRPFELALVITFGGLALLAMFLLLWYEPADDTEGPEIVGTLQIWGTLPEEPMEDIFLQMRDADQEVFGQISYRYIPPEQFDDEFVRALADREEPDMLLISHEKLAEHRDRLYPLPYESFSRRDFRNLYVDGAELFTLSDGVYALPIAIDPLMLYWNRDILSTYSFLEPPATWEELVSEYAPILTERTDRREIVRSTVAMGTSNNVRNPVATLSMLIVQGGSLLVREQAGEYRIELNDTPSGDGRPLQSALRFYTRFADPTNPLYSWNRSQPADREAFVAEDLAFYFGYGSEAADIEDLNPNLNFDIAEVPQGATASVRRTYGKFYGLALVRTARNLSGANAVRNTLGSGEIAKQLAESYGMAPPHRTRLAPGSNDTYGRFIYESAPVARGWLNPDFKRTREIFADGVGDVNANRGNPSRAASDIRSLLMDVY
ncbi:MAG: extracellular solute-binding protein [Spirochaetes bacterium]|jgi:ABC-type glycerol-3-phosphate transport system substrate-binding protein|nr:extracellular solute-binding protein [Spirochaetota bacterium]